jgi:hypothetical protein
MLYAIHRIPMESYEHAEQFVQFMCYTSPLASMFGSLVSEQIYPSAHERRAEICPARSARQIPLVARLARLVANPVVLYIDSTQQSFLLSRCFESTSTLLLL